MICAALQPVRSLSEERVRALARRREERVVEVLNREADGLVWFLWARLAAEDEDTGGVDVVVLTADMGVLMLQVKSSETGRRKHIARARATGDVIRLNTNVVVVKDDQPDSDLFARTFGALILAREARQARMRRPYRTDGRKH